MKKRTIALLMAVVMLFGITVGSTIAWLTAESETVQNTFVVGDINIRLNEAKVSEKLYDDNSNVTGVEYNEFYYEDNSSSEGYEYAQRVEENTYKLTPGSRYFKDPKVTVLYGSEKCFVFVKVTELYNENNVIEYNINDFYWRPLDGVDNVYYYYQPVDVSENPEEFDTIYDDSSEDTYLNDISRAGGIVLPSVIDNSVIHINSDLDRDDVSSMVEADTVPSLEFVAYAVQYENMYDDPLYAWQMAQSEFSNANGSSSDTGSSY